MPPQQRHIRPSQSVSLIIEARKVRSTEVELGIRSTEEHVAFSDKCLAVLVVAAGPPLAMDAVGVALAALERLIVINPVRLSLGTR